MKVRSDFVTNSSSSSFVIAKKYLDNDQIVAIRRHGEIGKKLDMDCYDEPWNIEENKEYIGGHTSMDNFDMEEFLETIDVPTRRITWSDSYCFKLPSDWRSLL